MTPGLSASVTSDIFVEGLNSLSSGVWLMSWIRYSRGESSDIIGVEKVNCKAKHGNMGICFIHSLRAKYCIMMCASFGRDVEPPHRLNL